MTLNDKLQLIIHLCQLCKIKQKQLAQVIGQPQWIVDLTIAGKITNEVTVAAIVGRLLHIYRKSIAHKTEDSEEFSLFGQEKIEQWESGHKIDYDQVRFYLEKLLIVSNNERGIRFSSSNLPVQSKEAVNCDNYTDNSPKTPTIKKENQRTSVERRIKANGQSEKHESNCIQNRKKEKNSHDFNGEMPRTIIQPKSSSNRCLSDSPNKKWGMLIWDMMQFIVDRLYGKGKIIKTLTQKGYDTKILLSMRDGLYECTAGYQIVAAYLLHRIELARDISKGNWPTDAPVSYDIFQKCVNNPNNLEFTNEVCESIFNTLKACKVSVIIKTKNYKRSKKTVGAQYVRHRSYSSSIKGFDYGITDT